MSIINEALKKTGQFIQENETKNNPPAKIIPGPKPLLIYILILLVGILLSKFIFAMLSQKPEGSGLASNKPQGDEIKIIQPPAVLPVGPVLPSENNKTPQPKFVLNGIFFSENDGYALVNNQIVRENDSVDGAKVTRITVNSVELDSDGKLTSLSTRR